MFELDRKAFRIQTFEEADSHILYWRTRPVVERVAAMVELTRRAFNVPDGRELRIDRSEFRIKSRYMQLFTSRDLREFLEALNRAAVDYLLVGGYAVNVHGYSRSTGDVDVWVQPTEKNYSNLVKACNRLGLPMDAVSLTKFLDTDRYDVFSFGRPPSAIDLMTKVKGLDFDLAYDNSTVYEFDELPVRVISLRDLLKAKRATGRLRDLADVEQLVKIEEE